MSSDLPYRSELPTRMEHETCTMFVIYWDWTNKLCLLEPKRTSQGWTPLYSAVCETCMGRVWLRYAWLKQCQWISDGENWVSEHRMARKLSQGNSKRRSLLSAGCGMGICQTCHFLFCSLPAKGLSFAVCSLFFFFSSSWSETGQTILSSLAARRETLSHRWPSERFKVCFLFLPLEIPVDS